MMFHYIRIGGVKADLPPDIPQQIWDYIEGLEARFQSDFVDLIQDNEIFISRTRGVGKMTGEKALEMGLTGPPLRCTGVDFDIRRDYPYSIYPELEFDIPTRSEGDCLARYLLRMDELKQSLRIIDQCLHNMPDGPIMAKLPRLLRPRPGRAYAAVEGPRGQYAAYVISDGTDQPFRMRIHDPSFVHLQAVGVLVPGHLIADAMAVMASLDPIMGGVDK